ncbi:MAG: hypothetical protein WAU70_12495, partial [Flavobacteriales bacterium]
MQRTILLGLLLGWAGTSSAIYVELLSRPETCGNMNGAISTNPSGTPPFIFAWTGPNGFTSTADTLFGLDAGIYDVMMIDGAQDTTYNSTEVMDQPDLGYGGGPTWAGVSGLLGYWGGACVGQCNGAGAFVEA